MGAEQKLYKKLKSKTPKIIWNRIENLAIPGMPDLLGYNSSGTFFTVELKVTKGRKIRFSPHQISWHFVHPKNTFILVQALGPRSTNRFHLYPGSGILALETSGRDLEPFCLGLDAIRDFLYQLGAWRLQLAACSLELGAWSLELGTCRPGFLLLGAWGLKLGACSLKLTSLRAKRGVVFWVVKCH